MNRALSSVWCAAALLSYSVLLSGCISHTTVYEDEVHSPKPTSPSKPAKSHGSSKNDPKVIKHERHFYYYPACEVYRDCETNYWFWQEGDAWKISATLPKSKRVGKDKPLLIVMDDDHPQRQHQEVRKKHPAVLAPVQTIETNDPKKSLPAHAKGKAKGHAKQNDKSEPAAALDVVRTTEIIEPAVLMEEPVDAEEADDRDHAEESGKPDSKAKDKDPKVEKGEKDSSDDDSDKEQSDKKNSKDKSDKSDKKGKNKKKD